MKSLRRRRSNSSPLKLEPRTDVAVAAARKRAKRPELAETAAGVSGGPRRSLTDDRLRAAWDASPDAIFLYDTVRNARGRIIDFRIIDANAAGVKFAGLPRQELLGCLVCDRFPFVRARGFFADEVRVVETGVPLTHEIPLEVPGFAAKWVEKRVMKAGDGMIAIFCDITRRKGTAEILRATVYELNEAQRLGRIGSWFWEIEPDRVTWSEELYRIAGRDPRGPPPSYAEHPQLYTPESWARLQAAVTTCVQTGTSYDLELELIRPDGATCWVNARGEAERDSSGKIVLLRGTAQDITARKQAELALQSLPRRILEAQETERRRVARELHDGVSQLLASTNYRLHVLEEALPEARRPLVVPVRDMVGRALREVRRISHGLRPSSLDDFGLGPALRILTDGFQQRTSVKLALRLPRGGVRLPAPVEDAFYRIAQEALANIERHAGARAVHLRVTRAGRQLRLSIRDDGRGFADSGARHATGLGLLHMRERAELAGGTFELRTEPGQGSTITVDVQLPPGP